jgi:predicted RNase H-like HicB family nuclease
MRNLEYPIALRPLGKDEGGGRLAEFPDLPGCMADGATPEEAMKEAADAVRSWIKTAKAHGDPIPRLLRLLATPPQTPAEEQAQTSIERTIIEGNFSFRTLHVDNQGTAVIVR